MPSRQKTKGNPEGNLENPYRKKRLDEYGKVEWLLMHDGDENLKRWTHNLFPSFNRGICGRKSGGEKHNYPLCRFSEPRPIFVANQVCEPIDLCHRRTMAQENQTKLLVAQRSRYQTAIKKRRTLRHAEKIGVYHNLVYNVAERIESNTDPYFNSCYDYFYTGGNLSALSSGSYLIHVSGKDLLTLNIAKLIPDVTLELAVERVSSHTVNADTEVFEVNPIQLATSEYTENFYTRQHHIVTLFGLNSSGQIKACTKFFTKRAPVISCAQSTADCNKFLISNMAQEVHVYNIDSRKLTDLYNLSEMEHEAKIGWNTVKYMQDNIFLYANEKCMSLMDLRSIPETWLSTPWSFPDSRSCDTISCVVLSKFKNLLYVGTSHKLFCVDVRCLGRSLEEAAICHWTHQLEYPPVYLDTYRFGSNEFIALSSLLAGDLHICELTQERTMKPRPRKYNYVSHCSPYQPPTLQEAYESARLAGKCLEPHVDLKGRIACCTTGMKFYNLSQDANELSGVLLTANSSGDVFAHNVGKRDNQCTEDRTSEFSNNIMHEYEQKIKSLAQPDLQYTDIVDFKVMRKIFQSNQLTSIDIKHEKANTEESDLQNTRRWNLGRWQKSVASLHNYKDMLVKSLLSIWDIEPETENLSFDDLQRFRYNKPNPDAIVSQWFESNDQEEAMTTLHAVPDRMDTDYKTFSLAPPGEEFVSSTQITDWELQHALNSDRISQVATKKKRTYVKGF